MLLKWIDTVEQHLRRFVQQHYGITLDRLTVSSPPKTEMGDLAFPFPFELAKSLRKPPRQIAQEVAAAVPAIPEVSRFEAAGGGYVNVFYSRPAFFRELYRWVRSPFPAPDGEKVIVEHTNINPNKAAHIGHLRNAALGDSFVRLLRAGGNRVEVQNYIDNTGVQVADVVVGFQHLRQLSLDQVKAIPDPFDYYCWDLYAEVSDWFSKEESRLQLRFRMLKEIEEGHGTTAELAEYVSNRIVKAHLATMLRLGVRYDVLPRESEILHLRFWDEAFRKLKEHGTISFAEEGPSKGCWVMQLPGEDDESAEEKIIVRSNGTVTYVGKDIAYQLWKFGLLDKTFRYRPFHQYPDGQVVWARRRRKTATLSRILAVVPESITSSTSVNRTCSESWCRACEASATRVRPTSRFTFPTKWSRSRQPAARIWASNCLRRTAIGPTLRCPAVRASESRPTI